MWKTPPHGHGEYQKITRFDVLIGLQPTYRNLGRKVRKVGYFFINTILIGSMFYEVSKAERAVPIKKKSILSVNSRQLILLLTLVWFHLFSTG